MSRSAGKREHAVPLIRHVSRLTPRASRPYVVINMAMTADGKIANATRSISSFGSNRDLDNLYALRATADALMNGARTIEANNVTMGNGRKRFRDLRRRRGLLDYPLRIVVSGSGSVDPGAAIFKHSFSPILILSTQRAEKKLKRVLPFTQETILCGEREISFRAALQYLRTNWMVKRLVCEGGAELNDALLRADLVDEIHVTICPFVFGGRGAPTMAEGVGAPKLALARRFKIDSYDRVDDELFLVLHRKKGNKVI